MVLNAGRLAKEFDVERARGAFASILSDLRTRKETSLTE